MQLGAASFGSLFLSPIVVDTCLPSGLDSDTGRVLDEGMTTAPIPGLTVWTARGDAVTAVATYGARTTVRYSDGTLVQYWTESLRVKD